MKLRKWTAEEKMAIVLEGVKGLKSVAEICREHQISQALFIPLSDCLVTSVYISVVFE